MVALTSITIHLGFSSYFFLNNTITVEIFEPKSCIQVQWISLSLFLEFPFALNNIQCNSFKFFPGKKWYFITELGCITLVISSAAEYIFQMVFNHLRLLFNECLF